MPTPVEDGFGEAEGFGFGTIVQTNSSSVDTANNNDSGNADFKSKQNKAGVAAKAPTEAGGSTFESRRYSASQLLRQKIIKIEDFEGNQAEADRKQLEERLIVAKLNLASGEKRSQSYQDTLVCSTLLAGVGATFLISEMEIVQGEGTTAIRSAALVIHMLCVIMNLGCVLLLGMMDFVLILTMDFMGSVGVVDEAREIVNAEKEEQKNRRYESQFKAIAEAQLKYQLSNAGRNVTRGEVEAVAAELKAEEMNVKFKSEQEQKEYYVRNFSLVKQDPARAIRDLLVHHGIWSNVNQKKNLDSTSIEEIAGKIVFANKVKMRSSKHKKTGRSEMWGWEMWPGNTDQREVAAGERTEMYLMDSSVRMYREIGIKSTIFSIPLLLVGMLLSSIATIDDTTTVALLCIFLGITLLLMAVAIVQIMIRLRQSSHNKLVDSTVGWIHGKDRKDLAGSQKLEMTANAKHLEGIERNSMEL
eukprot:gene23901-2526_t